MRAGKTKKEKKTNETDSPETGKTGGEPDGSSSRRAKDRHRRPKKNLLSPLARWTRKRGKKKNGGAFFLTPAAPPTTHHPHRRPQKIFCLLSRDGRGKGGKKKRVGHFFLTPAPHHPHWKIGAEKRKRKIIKTKTRGDYISAGILPLHSYFSYLFFNHDGTARGGGHTHAHKCVSICVRFTLDF